MEREKIMTGLARLGEFFRTVSNNGANNAVTEWDTEVIAGFQQKISMAAITNPWFTHENVLRSFSAWGETLRKEELENWQKDYVITPGNKKTVALIMAGNLPLVGFHDLISVLLSGHKALVKLSSDDSILMGEIIRLFYYMDNAYEELIAIAGGPLKNFEAAIATGSDNSARYFEYYFGKYPHIIRKNRTSLAVLSGNESKEDLFALGTDIFSYFGMGCRNVSHLLVPAGYDFTAFFEAIYPYGEIAHHNKYGNNYEYHKAVFLLEQVKFLDNNFLMIRESDELFSPLSVLHYSFYETDSDVSNYILDHKDKIQCVVGRDFISFGQTQQPGLADYADGVDTMKFLTEL